MSRLRKQALGVAAAVAIVAGAFVGISAATASGPNTEFYACMSSATHVIAGSITTSSSLTCGKGQVVVSWSAAGPRGATGPMGLPGSIGATGPKGPTGVKGIIGSNGASGSRGPTGATGALGPTTIAALQGTPCTFNGHPSTVSVSQDITTGGLTITCHPQYEVTGKGTMLNAIIVEDTTPSDTNLSDDCVNPPPETANCGTASVVMPGGDAAEILWASGEPGTGGGHSFSVVCPTGWTGGGTAAQTPPGLSYYLTKCDTSDVDADTTITAS